VGRADRVGRVDQPISYLALGDSYTIGTGATDESRNYPSILARRLEDATGRKVALTNPAVNGFTTQDLINEELPYLRSAVPQLVSILIGVNDLVQGRAPEAYRALLNRIYDEVAGLELAAGRVVAISIPNWSIVPAARDFGGRDHLRRLTRKFNSIARGEADSHRFKWIDITAASTDAEDTPGWISSDRLHPGDPQYRAWADVIWAEVKGSWVTP
jgi:acyl-CoA thioesterase I